MNGMIYIHCPIYYIYCFIIIVNTGKFLLFVRLFKIQIVIAVVKICLMRYDLFIFDDRVLSLDPPSLLLNDANSRLKSSVIKHNLDPDWVGETLTLRIPSIDLERLSELCSIVVSVWDEDMVSADDLIGIFTIPLRDILDHFKNPLQKGSG